MKQPPKNCLALKPTALACAVSGLFITGGLTPLSAQAACTTSGSVTTCDAPFSSPPYEVPANPSPTLNINGTQTYSGQAEWLFTVSQANTLSTINFDSALTWDNIIYKLEAVPVSSLIGGAINVGNISKYQRVGGSVFFESTPTSSITLNISPAAFNANEPVSLSGMIINASGSSGTNEVAARLNGNITINDVDHGANLTRAIYGAVIRAASEESDIENTGTIKVNAASQSNAIPYYYGLESQSYNYATYSPSYTLKNSGTISIDMPGTSSGYNSTGL